MITNGAYGKLHLEPDEEANFAALVDERELAAGSGKMSKFSKEDVELALRRIDAATVVDQIKRWRELDRQTDQRGGPTSHVDDRGILAVCLLLAREHTPLWVTEMRNVLWFRLTDDAREVLGIAERMDTGDNRRDAKNWYDRAWRAMHRLIAVMDPYPKTPKKLMSWTQRQAVLAARDEDAARQRKIRLDWFSNQMLEMTFQLLPRRIRRAWKGDLSVDQTEVKAPSRTGIPTTSEKNQRAMVMEIDARWHIRNPALRGGNVSNLRPQEFDWAYEANIFATTSRDPNPETREHPHMIIGFTLSRPNEDLGGETVRGLQSIHDRGHPAGRITGDQAYFDNLTPENLHNPVRELGYFPLSEYRDDNLGLIGGKGGAIQVEGSHYCPAMTTALVDASKDLRVGLIDAGIYAERINERSHFELRAKERPDANGHVPMMCPAAGPGATIECPLRAIHPNSSKKAKPVVLESNLPKKPDRICTQSSVDFGPEDGLEHGNALAYGTKEFLKTYKYDRQVIESVNAFVKDTGRENLGSAGVRRLRGMAAQQVLVTILLVSANIRKVSAFLRTLLHGEKNKGAGPRRRDREGLSYYVKGRRRSTTKKTAAQHRPEEQQDLDDHIERASDPPWRE